jgi:hypothetical protein
MMRRVYYLSVMACLMMLTFVSGVRSQSKARRGEPSNLSAGYYVVDSDDDAPAPWRPDYFFLDTSYNRFEWNRIVAGPRQFLPPGPQPNAVYWNNPKYGTDYVNMDTDNEAMAGLSS